MVDKQLQYEIRANVQGRDSVIRLADDLDNIAKVLSADVSQQAQAAAARLRELARQDEAITAFNRLQTEARGIAAALKAADAEAAAYAAQIGTMGPPTAQEAAALQRLQTAAEGTRQALDQQKAAISAAQGELQKFGVSSQSVQVAQQRVRAEIAAVRDQVSSLAPSYQGAASSAEAAGGTMVRTHRQIGDGVESISQQLARLQNLYGAITGVSGARAMIGELTQIADAVNNLSSRMKLVTGDGAAFTETWDGITAVALRTHSALEETGTLFTRLAQAGKDAGLSAASAARQAIALTETINQTVQLSGASAEASSAAITQLIQGLQSGVLRGDEFNSVMEQAPRLARALADGLGATTGELRKMAEAGALSSETVIKALKGQSDVISSEFSKLPPTVGRALQDLATQWTLYVSEADKATGVSVAAARAISGLASNLKTVAGLLIDVGQAAAAFAALRLAQQFLGIGVAAQQAAIGVAAANTQIQASTAAAASAAASAGRFAAILGGLRTFTLLGLVTNFQDIGTWIGEGIAKLAGYKARLDELERTEQRRAAADKEAAADRARLAAATQLAIDRQFDLSKAAGASVAEFERLTKEGTSSAEALKKTADAFDLSKIQGIRDFAAVLDKLAASGRLAAGEVQAAWSRALTGQDLMVFEANARAAFGSAQREAEQAAKKVSEALSKGLSGSELQALQDRAATAFAASTREGEKLAAMLDAVLREAVNRTGLEFSQLQGRIGATSRSALNDTQAIIDGLDRLKAQGVDVGRVLNASLSKAIDSADSQRALDAVRQQIESVRKVLGDKVADGFLDQARQKGLELGDALDRVKPGVNNLREAMQTLGLKTREELVSTAKRATDAFETITRAGQAEGESYAAWQARKAAAATAMLQRVIEANGGVTSEAINVRAAMEGLTITVDNAGRAIVSSMNQGQAAAAGMAAGFAQSAAAADAGADRTVSALERETAAMKKLREATEAAADEERKRLAIDKDGFSTDKSGNRLVAGSDLSTRTGIAAFLKAAGVDDEAAARRIANEFANSRGEIDYFNNAGQKKYGGDTLSMALLRAAETYTFNGANSQTSSVPAQTQTININLGGRTTSITLASSADADALRQLLQQLATAAGRAA